MRSTLVLTAVGLFVALAGVTACGGARDDEGASTVSPEQARADTTGVAQRTAQRLREAGFEPASARGEYVTCRSEPAPGVAYRIGITARGDGDAAAQVRRLAEVMERDRWEVLSGPSADGASFRREGLRAVAGESREEGAVALAVTGECVDLPADGADVPLRRQEDVDLG
ncbi:hypothetical protein [Nocardioides aurantiacus]|uniref:LytR cell envelope-related transcriptional attenuator n=1 Tax=Nocardioides aurantiacus TaxID=86796 RepID=A0A3N2CYF5_9ACTN|nr:hypothetical protein [Nocardioides aurantiacus]ROR92549.1 hypothetical protein EDD33_3440 [Nocardioides aurantiacus]